VGQQAPESLDLTGQEAAGGRGEKSRGPDDRCLDAMGNAESVVDIGVVAGREAVDEGGIVGLLTGIEAEVVQESHARGQLRQSFPDRSQVVAGVTGPVGSSQMGADGDVGAVTGEPVQRRHGGPDTEVVGHHRGTGGTVRPPERDVEVGTDENFAAVDVGEILEKGKTGERIGPGGCHRPTRAARSTRRLA
jgi:hypothetical protein